MLSSSLNRSGNRNLDGTWHSLFQTNSVGVVQWYPEQLSVAAPGDGTFKSTSVGDSEKATFHWTATGSVLNDEFLCGTWTTNQKKKSAGTFMLSIAPGSKHMVGFLLGRSERRNAVNYGAWVLAVAEADLEAAKGLLADLSPGFKEFIYLGTADSVSAKLRSLRSKVRLNESQTILLCETVRCVECEAFRAAAVCGWSLAFDLIKSWVWADAHRRAKYLNKCKQPPHTYKELRDGRDKDVLDGMRAAGILGGYADDLTLYLRRRNKYAHASDFVPSIDQINEFLDHLVDIVCSGLGIK
jgi:hypothetical protein